MKSIMVFVVLAMACVGAAQAVQITFEMEGELDWTCPGLWCHSPSSATAEGTWGGTVTFNLEYYFWPGEDPTVEDISVYVLSYVSSDLEIYSGVTHEWGGDPYMPEYYPPYDYWGTLEGATIDFRLYNNVYWCPDGGTEWEFLNYEMDFTVTFYMPTMGEITLESDIASPYSGAMSLPEDLYAGTGTWTGNVSAEGLGYSFLPFSGTQIPEPATMILLGAGLATVAGIARQRITRK